MSNNNSVVVELQRGAGSVPGEARDVVGAVVHARRLVAQRVVAAAHVVHHEQVAADLRVGKMMSYYMPSSYLIIL